MRCLLLFVAACASSSQQAAPSNTAAADSPIYSDLFTRGAKWQFHSIDKTEDPGRQEWVSTCSVVATTSTGDTTTSTIACDHPVGHAAYSEELIAGTWRADSRGLWRVSSENKAHLVMPKTPIASHQKVEDIYDPGNREAELVIVAKGDQWCATLHEHIVATPEGGPYNYDSQWCIGKGGIMEGHALATGDESKQFGTYFTRR